MKICEIQCKTVLIKSKLPESDYCINPYVGCMHSCAYCYARFMRRFTNHPEKWGEFVDIKINAAEVLKKQLTHKPKRGVILLGSVTDAYQPPERKYGITRDILKILLRYDFPISILTKSDLVIRDVDLLRQFSACEVGFTITTLDEKVARSFEPHAPSLDKRLKALKVVHEAGIKTYAFVGPILPGFTDLHTIFSALQDKVDFIMAESLNAKCGNWENLKEILERDFPSSLLFFQSRLNKEYWAKVESEVRQLSEEFGLSLKNFYKH
ncbi:MAG: radical SAM protein [Patescibacteria group bacterium]|nr:radical SAM protein [Patescibacteria group bacterium]